MGHAQRHHLGKNRRGGDGFSEGIHENHSRIPSNSSDRWYEQEDSCYATILYSHCGGLAAFSLPVLKDHISPNRRDPAPMTLTGRVHEAEQKVNIRDNGTKGIHFYIVREPRYLNGQLTYASTIRSTSCYHRVNKPHQHCTTAGPGATYAFPSLSGLPLEP